MKVDRKGLREDIEDILSEGVVSGEEIDITASKVMDRLADLLTLAENYQPHPEETDHE